MEQLQDINIKKAGTIESGKYNNIFVKGGGTVKGDIECNTYSIDGASIAKGNITAANFKIGGMTTIEGSLNAGTIEIAGNTEVKGGIKAANAKVEGHCGSKNDMEIDDLYVKGSITARANCIAKKVDCSGFFEVSGILQCGTLILNINGTSTAKEIKCEKIDVRKQENFASRLQGLLKKSKQGIDAETVEAKEIYMESANVKVLRGDNVIIGPDCNIELVEYKNNIEIKGNSKVKEQRKL